ncbi:MAG: hypothetical protein IKG42_05700 [Clostridia bacterium]|nr:hypothetical protein [Clostridia bacterium]
MDKKIRNFQIFSIVFTLTLGALLHFTYEWSGGNKIVSLFSAVNESTWEHLKLVFYPMLITTIIGYFYLGKDYSNFLCSKTKGILVAISFIIFFFYTYTGIIGRNFAIIDISSFIIATILGEITSYLFIINTTKCNNKTSKIILTILLLCFITFTFITPKIGLFKDPVTGTYGIQK